MMAAILLPLAALIVAALALLVVYEQKHAVDNMSKRLHDLEVEMAKPKTVGGASGPLPPKGKG